MKTSGMLGAPMRAFVAIASVLLLVLLGATTYLVMRGPTDAEASEIAAVLAPTGSPGAPPAYAHCASCHLHDGSGRPDGSIPRLNGQRRAVLEQKLHRLRAGMTPLPVMAPFARALETAEITEVASYLSSLPDTLPARSDLTDEERSIGATLFAEHCASCHGANGEGHDGLFASRLCGQYAGYLERRLQEVETKVRGDSDAIMQGVLESLPVDDLEPVVKWLAAGKGCGAP